MLAAEAIADTRYPLIPGFDVVIDGTPMHAEARAHVTRVAVDESVELPSMFTLELVSSIELAQPLRWIDDQKLFAIGATVEIKLGYADKVKTVMSGEITGLEPEFAVDRPCTVTVRGYDRRHRLQRGRKTRSFVEKKDSDIAEQIAAEAGLSAQVKDSQVLHDYVLQANQTDWEFLCERARRIQYEILAEDKKLLFQPVANAESPVLTLSLSKKSNKGDLLEFYPRLTAMGQVSEVAVRGWNVKDKKEIVAPAKAGGERAKMGGEKSGSQVAESAFGAAVEVFSTHPVMAQAEADQIAKARLNDLALGLISGEGVCFGRTDLRAGKVIKIEGVGDRFSGCYYVTSAVHRYTPQRGYRTHFAVQRNAV